MKKLMIAAAIVCAAAFAQAAQISWSSNKKALCDANGNPIAESGLPTGTELVLVSLGASTDWSKATAILVSDDVSQSSVSIGSSGTKMGQISGKVIFNWTSGAENVIDNGDYLGLMLRDKTTGALSMLSYVGGDEATDALYLVDGIANSGSSLTGKAIAFGDNFTAESVPEPTSGLLLLLGVAGLALRRRRA